jgi:hypothetical protein
MTRPYLPIFRKRSLNGPAIFSIPLSSFDRAKLMIWIHSVILFTSSGTVFADKGALWLTRAFEADNNDDETDDGALRSDSSGGDARPDARRAG